MVLLVGLSSFMATEWAFIPLIRDLLKRSAAAVRQPELPWGKAERKPIAEEAAENRQKAATGLRKFWQTMRGQFHSYDHGGEEGEGGGGEGGGIDGVGEGVGGSGCGGDGDGLSGGGGGCQGEGGGSLEDNSG